MDVSSSHGCPPADALLALVEGSLEQSRVTSIRGHLDDCEECQAAVAAVLGSSRTGATVERTSNRVGKTIGGRYAVRSVIGAGAMAVVYEAWDSVLERTVALKTLATADPGKAAHLGERLVAESKMLARLKHPNVVAVHDVLIDGDTVVVAMERVEGPSLRVWAEQEGRTWTELLFALRGAARGLEAAHEVGVVHRDFKPDNVLVAPGDRVLVADFGLARLVGGPPLEVLGAATERERSAVGLTATGALVGTPVYMAPEQFTGDTVDARTDVFAFCVSAYELLAGQRPFTGSTVEALAATKRAGDFLPLPSAVPRRVRAVIEAGLQAAPERRPESMRPIVEAFGAPDAARRWPFVSGAIALIATGAWMLWPRPGAQLPCVDLTPRSSILTPIRERSFEQRGKAQPRYEELKAALRGFDASFKARWDAACALRGKDASLERACLTAQSERVDATTAGWYLGRQALGDVLRELPEPTSCAASVVGTIVPSAAPEIRPAVEALELRVGAAEELVYSGRFELAEAQLDTIISEARGLGYQPLLANALFMRGFSASSRGALDDARAHLIEAARTGIASGHDFVAAQAWLELMDIEMMDGNSDFERAGEYASLARGAIEGMRGVPAATGLEFSYALKSGKMRMYANELDEARGHFERALEFAETDNRVERALVLEGLGLVHRSQGEFDQALATQKEVLEIRQLEEGPDNPSVLYALYNVAADAFFAGKTDVALEHVRRARGLAEHMRPDADEMLVNALVLELQLLGADGASHDEVLEHAAYLRAVMDEAPREDPLGRAALESEVAELLYRADATLAAVEAATRGIVAADAIDPPDILAISLRATLLHALLDLGRIAECTDLVAQIEARNELLEDARSHVVVVANVHEARARYYVATGALERARPSYAAAIAGFESDPDYATNGLLARRRWAMALWDAGMRDESRAEAMGVLERREHFEDASLRADFEAWAEKRGVSLL